MTPTLTITEEAQAFFARNPDPALRELVDQGIRDYSEHFRSLPVILDTDEDPDTGHVQAIVAVEVVPELDGKAMDRLIDFMKEWRPAHTAEERRAVGFAIRYA